MAKNGKLLLFETQTCEKFAEVESEGLDVFFPTAVRGWSDVLDCRIAPYDARSIEENCEFALGCRKFYILVHASQVTETPTASKE